MPEARRGRKALVAGLVVCAAAAAALVVVVLRPGSEAETAPSANATQASQAAPATPPSAAMASVPVTTLPSASPAPTTPLTTHFTSDPGGVVVKEDGKEICASTPCDHDFEPDPTHEHKLVFTKPGFRPETRMIHAGDSPVAVHLVAARAWTAPAQAKPAETNAPTPQGFKEIPY
jgi:hypothetical protein